VRGFASAGLAKSAVKENLEYAYKKVGNDDENFSKAFNLYIAEKRAENLVTKIKEMIGDKKKHRHIFGKWKNYQEMVTELNIDDTEKGEYEKPRGFLT
jgi:hypothetical protein